MYGNSHSERTCVQTGMRILYELKGVHLANFEVDLFSSSVEYIL